MRVVRDFIDRLAARAVGGESVLSPRLPSLFEPQRGSPVGLPEEAGEVVAPAPHEAVAMEHRVVTQRENPLPPASVDVRVVTKAIPSMVQEEGRAAKRVAEESKPASSAPIARPKAIEADNPQRLHSPHAPAPVHDMIPPALVQRQRLREVMSDTEGRKAADEGSLLAPAQSVFRTAPASVTAASARFPMGRTAQTMQPPASPEPVVHVSIGRLEVRATPSPGKSAAHRRDAPPSSPMDDYLRQRGKASP